MSLGLQLFCIRELCTTDLAAGLRETKAAGYEAVEFAGYHNHSATELRAMLDAAGLSCCGTHIREDALAPDKLEATIAFHRTLGCDMLIVPWLPREKRCSPESIALTARWFTNLAKRLAGEGMKTGYHAHADDFDKVAGSTGYELLFDAMPPEVIMQMDTGNVASAGVDPLTVLRRFPGRSLSVHLKEHGAAPTVAIGEGTVPFQEVIHFCRTQGGTQHFVVETNVNGPAQLEVARRCRAGLRRFGL